MAIDVERTVELLVRFTRLAAAAPTPDEILPLLAHIGRDVAGAQATAVLRVGDDGEAHIAASAELPAAMRTWHGDADTIGAEAADAMVAASAGAFAQAVTLPLVSGSGLFGALVLLFARRSELDRAQRHLAEALCDLAATVLDKSFQLAALARTNAELRESREILARGEKLRALGQASAGISHDIKNILNPLALQVQLMRRRLAKGGEPEKLEEVLQMMQASLATGLEVVERLRDFSRQNPERTVEPVELDRVADSAIELARPRCAQLARPVALERVAGAPPLVNGSVAEMTTAVVNLLFNACDALESSGSGGRIVVRTGAADGGGFIEVEDDGPGMSEEVQARLFEPFFTTKGKEGTGLGLPMVYSLLQRHRGRVELSSAPGRGSRFRLWLPAA